MRKNSKKTTVAIADDHNLMRTALAKLVNTFEGYTVVIEAENGIDLRTQIVGKEIPDVVMLDLTMPLMDGFEVTQWLNKKYPQIKILVLSMLSDEKNIIKVFRLGAKGYLLKNADPEELEKALDSLMNKDVYLSEYVSTKILSGLYQGAANEEKEIVLSEKDRDFLRWACSELPYKEIGEKMGLTARAADDIRQSLFFRLKVHSRVGLVLYAIKNGIIAVEDV